jgi:hypothetical protein
MNMQRTSVGGRLDYNALAMLHRPKDPARIASEVHRLHETGLTATDIATALRIDSAQVRNVLGAQANHRAVA